MPPPCHTLLSYWDASAIAAQNWLTRYPTVDSANKLSHAKRIRQIPSTNVLIRDVTDLDTSKDRKSSWAIPPIKFQSYRWLLRCSAVHAPRDISRFTFFSSPKVIGCYFILSFSHFNLNWVHVLVTHHHVHSQVKPVGRREGRKTRWSEEQQSKDWISVCP